MANLSVTNTFSNGTTADAPQVNTNFSDIVTYINVRNAGSTAWDALSVTGTSTLTGAVSCASTLGVTGVLTATGGIATLLGYRRPNLVYVSATTIDVESNTGTSNQTTIVFTDGTVRSVTEDTSSTHKYRRFLITAAAEFTSGTEDSGLRSGISEATNTWYAIYAVKSAIDTTKFVLAGDTTLPLQANFATLNTRYGTSGWLYLGLIRNGNNDTATGDILNFVQSSGTTTFVNAFTSSRNSRLSNGTVLASAGAGAVLTYTYSAGTGTTDIPGNLSFVSFGGTSGTGNDMNVSSAGETILYDVFLNAGRTPFLSAASGLALANIGSRDILLCSFIDNALGSSINPMI